MGGLSCLNTFSTSGAKRRPAAAKRDCEWGGPDCSAAEGALGDLGVIRLETTNFPYFGVPIVLPVSFLHAPLIRKSTTAPTRAHGSFHWRTWVASTRG